MYKDSYGQRLKEIREKYGSSVKDTTACIKSHDRHASRTESFFDGKYGSSKMGIQNTVISKNFSENVDPLGTTNVSRKYSTLAFKEKQAQHNFDSFLYTQSKQQRLKQIQKIRQSVAKSKKQAMEDWNREAQRSKSKYVQSEKYSGLRERTNTYVARNPQQNRFNEFKESTAVQTVRNRGMSFTSTRIEPDLQLNSELRRNYDYSRQDVKKVHQNRDIDYENRRLASYRSNSVSKFDREIEAMSGGKNFGCTTSIQLKGTRPVENIDTTSPIRGLMKLDSLQKTRRTETYQPENTLSKFSNTNYDLTNIDKIQERIQKILSKK